MGMFKELDYELQELYKQQVQVGNDGSDIVMGIVINDFEHPACKRLQMLLEEPIMAKGLNKHRVEKRRNASVTVHMSLYLPWEAIGCMNRCTRWDIQFHNDKKYNLKFLSFSHAYASASDADVFEAA